MTREQSGRIIAALAAIGFMGTAGLHSTGYDSVNRLAAEIASDLGPVMPALWLVFSLDLAIIGLIVAAVAHRPGGHGRLILAIAACCPLGAAGLQLRFIGFVFPTAVLLAVGGLTLTAAVVLTPDSSRPAA